MGYVDGFLLAVKSNRREEYRELAEKSAPIFKQYGAVEVVECWGHDVPEGKVTSFPIAVRKEEDETVVFSWIRWPSKATRDEGMKKFMEDPRMKALGPMPFDGQRMIFGGFEILTETE